MAKREFRTPDSIRVEKVTREAIVPLLLRHGFDILGHKQTSRGPATTQVVAASHERLGSLKMRVRLCWRRQGRTDKEQRYSAAQLRANLIEEDWDKTLDHIASREVALGNTHNLIVQYDVDRFVLAALIPSSELPAIWRKQRDVSANLIASGHRGRARKNHATNGNSPTLWLQDDRTPTAHAVADALWSWSGVTNILSLPIVSSSGAASDDTLDDLPYDPSLLGRDWGVSVAQIRSGFPRDPKVRRAVLDRAAGRCERRGCGQGRDFPGFLDVHHILGVSTSDRIWTCVALCPNCHKEAHFAPHRDSINQDLQEYAEQFRS